MPSCCRTERWPILMQTLLLRVKLFYTRVPLTWLNCKLLAQLFACRYVHAEGWLYPVSAQFSVWPHQTGTRICTYSQIITAGTDGQLQPWWTVQRDESNCIQSSPSITVGHLSSITSTVSSSLLHIQPVLCQNVVRNESSPRWTHWLSPWAQPVSLAAGTLHLKAQVPARLLNMRPFNERQPGPSLRVL